MKKLLTLSLVLGMSGCSTQQFGSFSNDAPIGYLQIMAKDTANQMAVLYPPASTRLSMELDARDNFGKALIEQLRVTGYAVQEAPVKGSVPSGYSGLGYVIDSLGDDMYRVTVTVGRESLSRAYFGQDHRITPAGLWARKE